MEVCAIADHFFSSDTVSGDKTDDILLRGVAASTAGLSLLSGLPSSQPLHCSLELINSTSRFYSIYCPSQVSAPGIRGLEKYLSFIL